MNEDYPKILHKLLRANDGFCLYSKFIKRVENEDDARNWLNSLFKLGAIRKSQTKNGEPLIVRTL